MNFNVFFPLSFLNDNILLNTRPVNTRFCIHVGRKPSYLGKGVSDFVYLVPSFYFMTKKGNWRYFLIFFAKNHLLHTIKQKLRPI